MWDIKIYSTRFPNKNKNYILLNDVGEGKGRERESM